MGMEVLFGSMFFLVLLAVGGVSVLGIWWLWRKLMNPNAALAAPNGDSAGPEAGGARPLLPIKRLNLEKHFFIARMVVISILAMMMLVPLSMIQDLVSERGSNYREGIDNINQEWGNVQVLVGPILVIPYETERVVKETVPLTEEEKKIAKRRGQTATVKTVEKTVTDRHETVLLPDSLNLSGDITIKELSRGIYSAKVYEAALALKGAFSPPDFSQVHEKVSRVLWEETILIVQLSDTRAFKAISPLALSNDAGQKEYRFFPGTQRRNLAPTGFSAEVDLSPMKEGQPLDFSFTMDVAGSQAIYLAPLGINSKFDIKSSWPSPKFTGGLPQNRKVTDQGFTADWDVPNLVRNYPQFGNIDQFVNAQDSGQQIFYEYLAGIELFEPVNQYLMLTRATKFGIMFIGLTFLSVLIFEIAAKRKKTVKLHLAQYGLIGLALSVFYLMLLATVEHLPFIQAYSLAAGLDIVLISGYVYAALKSLKETSLVFTILSALYLALYFILNMEDYALLSGTALIVLALAALMHATRNLARGGDENAVAEETAKA